MLTGTRPSVLATLAATVETAGRPGWPPLVGITGIDASGKTRLAGDLADVLLGRGTAVQVVHVDDFHHPRHVRYAAGVPEPDRYLHYSFDFDRLVEQILLPIRRDGVLRTELVHLDLPTDTFTARRAYTVGPATVVLVEGVFLLRPEVRRLFDLVVFVHVPERTALHRGRARDAAAIGADPDSRYVTKYLPAQRMFHARRRPGELADIVLDNTDVDRPLLLSWTPRQPRAVVFDLWNTLVPLPEQAKQQAFTRTAAALGVPADVLAGRWAQTRAYRETQPLTDYLRWLRADLAARWPDAALDEAARVRGEIHGGCFTTAAVRDHAQVLARLRAAGLKTAVVSNCSSDVRQMLATCPLAPVLDAAVLSAEAGVMKPDPGIYARAAAALRVPASACVYVGDGSDNELAGAAAAGMAAVLLDPGPSSVWPGRWIRDLTDLLADVLPRAGADLPTPPTDREAR